MNKANAIFIKQLMNMFRSLSVNTFVNTSNESIMLPNKDLNTFFNGIVNFLNIVNLNPLITHLLRGFFYER